jgi:biotin carboxyl carrier protein
VDREYEARATDDLDGRGLVFQIGAHEVRVDGRQPVTVWDHADWRIVESAGRSYRLRRPAALNIADTVAGHARGGAGRLSAPMPGRIVKVSVSPGQLVQPNQPLVVLEAMKMEHVVDAPHAGVVVEICVEVGEQVRAGTVLLELGEAIE